jgi:hypothetical protein
MRNAAQNVMNEGPAKAEFLNNQYEQAQAHQDHIQAGVDNVKADAVQAITAPAQAIDAAKPEGVISKADLKDAMGEALGDMDKSQAPGSFKSLLADEKAGPRSTGPQIGGRFLDLSNPDDFKAFQNFKKAGVFSPEEIARMEGTSGTGQSMSFQELSQARTKLGQDAYKMDGTPAGAIAGAGYAKLSELLRGAAKDAGFEQQWLEGNAKYSKFSALQKALKPTLEGEDAADIMKPFGDKSRARVMGMLAEHPEAGFDMDGIQQSTSAYNHGEKFDRMSEPTRRTALVAAVNPKMAALSVGAPRMLRSQGVTQAIYGKGLGESTTKISPKQVYTNKAAAMAAMKKDKDE